MKIIYVSRGGDMIVDDDVYEWASKNRWHVDSKGYARRKQRYGPRKENKTHIIRLHRLIINAPEDMQVDHINGNKLDNRRENLRLCTNAQNCQNQTKRKTNTSGYKGVCFHKKTNKWTAAISVNYKRIYLGLFNTAAEAGKAYSEAAKKYHKDFTKEL